MKVAVIGANGQLGTDVAAAFAKRGTQVRCLTHSDIEVVSAESIESSLGTDAPELIVNTVAMHQVEQCEQRPDEAFAVNALGPKNLALQANRIGAVLMHVSTDYVFDGSKGAPYCEDDTPRPLNAYGVTKLAGEHFVRSLANKYFLVRTSALYGKSPCRGKGGLNFVELMLKLGRERGKVRVVDDEYVTPTSTKELARQMVALSESTHYGLYNATANGSCSWYEFAREIFAAAGVQATVEAAAPGEFPAKTPRPKYSVLDNRGLRSIGLDLFGSWQSGLSEYLSAGLAATN